MRTSLVCPRWQGLAVIAMSVCVCNSSHLFWAPVDTFWNMFDAPTGVTQKEGTHWSSFLCSASPGCLPFEQVLTRQAFSSPSPRLCMLTTMLFPPNEMRACHSGQIRTHSFVSEALRGNQPNHRGDRGARSSSACKPGKMLLGQWNMVSDCPQENASTLHVRYWRLTQEMKPKHTSSDNKNRCLREV